MWIQSWRKSIALTTIIARIACNPRHIQGNVSFVSVIGYVFPEIKKKEIKEDKNHNFHSQTCIKAEQTDTWSLSCKIHIVKLSYQRLTSIYVWQNKSTMTKITLNNSYHSWSFCYVTDTKSDALHFPSYLILPITHGRGVPIFRREIWGSERLNNIPQ